MSLEREIKRRKAYNKWKENMRGVPDKYKTSFSNYWKQVNKNS